VEGEKPTSAVGHHVDTDNALADGIDRELLRIFFRNRPDADIGKPLFDNLVSALLRSRTLLPDLKDAYKNA
jgi:hypothetical protein